MCRSFLGEWVDPETGLPRHDGRNNLGVVSLNLPRIAIESNYNVGKFWKLFNERLEIAHKALKQRIKRLENVKAEVAPILYCEGAFGVRLKPDDLIIDLFKNGRSSISLGYIGIHEMVNALFGTKPHLYEDKGKQNFAKSVVQAMRDACEKWKAEEGWGYSLYSTPSESLCDRFCRLDKERYGVIEGVTDKDYYTNSFHLDVEYKTDPFSKIKFESDYPAMASGGFINYVELPDMQHNLKAIEDVWDYSYKYVPYFGLNMPSDHCYLCDYHGEFDCTNKGFTCPNCGNKDGEQMNVIRRVCGYLSNPGARPFNKGKQEEVQRRTKHM